MSLFDDLRSERRSRIDSAVCAQSNATWLCALPNGDYRLSLAYGNYDRTIWYTTLQNVIGVQGSHWSTNRQSVAVPRSGSVEPSRDITDGVLRVTIGGSTASLRPRWITWNPQGLSPRVGRHSSSKTRPRGELAGRLRGRRVVDRRSRPGRSGVRDGPGPCFTNAYCGGLWTGVFPRRICGRSNCPGPLTVSIPRGI